MRRARLGALLCATFGCAQADLGDGGFSAGLGTAPLDDGPSTETMPPTTSATDSSADDSVSTDPTQPSDTAVDGTSTSAGPTGTDDESDATTSDSSTGGPPPSCGDGTQDPGEACDDANAIDTDACLTNCTAASCGDGLVYAGVEACDDGTNDGAYGGCNPGCAALAPYCGDGAVQATNEHCDGASGFASVGCTNCLFDFSAIGQLYCNGTCTWAGADSCDQADADIYCKLVTGDSTSVANSFAVVTALDAPGFACPGYGVNLGALPAYGVNVSVWYQDTSIAANHGAGSVVAQADCS